MTSQQSSTETMEQRMMKMNLGEEPLHENDQKESEISLNKSDEEKMKDHLQMEKRMINPLTLLRDDLLKVFKGKEAKTEHEDVKSTDVKTSQTTEKTVDPLSLFKEDFNQFKDDLSSVFRIGLSKDKGKKEDSKLKVVNVEGANKLFKTSQRLDGGFRGNLTEQNENILNAEEMNNKMKDVINPPENSELHANVSEEKSETSFYKTQKTEETTLNTGRPTGSSCQKTRFDDQKPTEAKSALTVEEPQQEKDQKDYKAHVQEDDLANEFDQEDHKDVKMKHHLKTSHREKRTIGLLTLFTEERFKVVKDKDTNRGHEDHPSTQTENKPTISTQSLLTDDSTEIREDVIFSVSSSTDKHVKLVDPKTSQTAEKSINRLSLLKDDFSNVFRIGLSKEKDNKKEPLKTSETLEDRQEVKSMFSERKEEQLDCGFQQNLPEQNKENHNAVKTNIKGRINQPEDSGLAINVSEETMCTSNTGRPRGFFKNLLRRDQNLLKTSAEDRREVKIMLSENKEGPLDCGFRENHLEQSEENAVPEKMNNMKDRMPDDSELKLNVSEEKAETSFSETQQSEEMMCTSNTGGPRRLLKNLFRKDQKPLKTSEKLEDSQEVKSMCSERKEEQLDCGFRETLSEQNKDKNRVNQPEDSELDLHVSDKKSVAESQQSEEIVSVGKLRAFSRPATALDDQSKSALLVEEPRQENNHRESEVCVQHEEFDQEDHKDKDVKVQDFLKMNQKKTIGPLMLFKEDFSHFKEDLLNVFGISLPKDNDNNEDSLKIKVLNAEKNKESCKRGEQLDVSEQMEETRNTKTKNNRNDRMDRPDGSEVGLKSETSFSVTRQSEQTKCTSHTAEDTADDEINVEKDGPSESLPWESFGISICSLTHANNDMRAQPGGGLWSPKDFATYLTFDPNTANSELLLSNDNRKATRVWSDHRPLDHPDRFKRCPQVLCREGLLDPVYWEVEWSGGADIGIAYNSISREGDTLSCLLGHNERSWSLECSEGSYTPCYNNRRFRSSSPEPFTRRVGVYLDWPAGTLSFYCISQDTLVPLHTFTSIFIEPLYAGFWIWDYEGSVSLCQVKMDWERLQ